MQYDATRRQSVRCSNCRGENFEFASFCISCGEPLDDTSAGDFDPSSGIARPATGQPERTVSLGMASARRLWRAESAIGLMVLLAAIGYALYTWHTTDVQSAAYRAGMEATANRDWDRAARSFSEAGDYRDAGRLRQEARDNAGRRDSFYYFGLLAQSKQNWDGAVDALEQVQNIQPGFQDSAVRLAEAREQVVNRGLEGIVYLVGGGPAPGLYIRDRHGRAKLLPGSDGRSVVRAISLDGTAFVYDRPSSEEDYLPGLRHKSIVQDSFGKSRSDRIPVLARQTPGGSIAVLPLPRLDSQGTGVLSSEGLWWSGPLRRLGALESELLYVSFANPHAPVPVSDYAAGERVVALDPARSRVILAHAAQRGSSAYRTSQIFLADAGGTNPVLLHSVAGEVQHASVSRDGMWLLLTTQQYSAGIELNMWAVSLDMTRECMCEQREARLLGRLVWSGLRVTSRIKASFIPSLGGENRVIVSCIDGARESLTTFDLDTGTSTLLWSGQPDSIYRSDLSALSHDGAYLALRKQKSDGAILGLAGIGPGSRTWSSVKLPAYKGQIVNVRMPAGDGKHVVAVVRNPDGIDRGVTQLVYSARVGDKGKLEEPKMLARANLPYEQELSALALPANGSQLAYIGVGEQLRTVALDGERDILVAEHVSAVWSLSPQGDAAWWR